MRMAAWCFVCHGMGDGSPFGFLVCFDVSGCLTSCLPWRSLIALPGMANPRRHIQAAGWWALLAGGISSAEEGPAASGQSLPGVAQRLLHQTFSRGFSLQPFWALLNAWHGCLCRPFSLQGAWPLCALLPAIPQSRCAVNRSAKGCHLLSGSEVKPMVGCGAKAQSLKWRNRWRK